uniref:Inositol hexakisphosphate and diphosphoinositol-pentakisphosphate kinase n=1 Tax=Globodera rostochiensis TaxID=31243 RepID=A0A914HZ78_GLORO
MTNSRDTTRKETVGFCCLTWHVFETAFEGVGERDGRRGSACRRRRVQKVCAMQRKANSKPMSSIMAKMGEFYKDYLDFIIFPEETILSEAVENWPLCDCLISFHSTDFPLKKAIEYEKLRRPYVLNDLHRQFDLLDRRKVFRTLARAGIDHPRHCVLIRNEKGELVGDELREFADHIEVNGMTFNKPFVEKPVNAEDHNIYIYYPSSVGGGSQRLFRKVNDRSSWYSPVSTVRKEGSYLYEEFIPADGTDVKVYAVGPYYAHAEARKAPGLDGKVERDADGKEVRYPVILSAKEKTIARRVVLAFGSVCGFDLLRANGCSYVCDVNGFSFVKTSTKYYEDTAKILGNTILRRLASSLSIPWHIPFQDDDPPLVSTPSGKIMELRCVLAVIRHGDRTPKQKMKVAVKDERFWKMFQKYDGLRKRELKLKKPTQLMEILEIVRQLLQESLEQRRSLLGKNTHFLWEKRDGSASVGAEHSLTNELEKCEEAIKTWEQMRAVLEMYGHFSGINRKVQLKYLKTRTEKGTAGSKGSFVLEAGKSVLQNPSGALGDDDSQFASVPTLFLILKWGGELTTAGVLQAEALGRLFRTLYPGIRRTDGKESPEDTQGLGFLRLHSTYRHDLKIYSSDEGRVQMTAAAFARGLLALEGELTPILMQMVKSANTDGLLNDDYNARQFQNDIKSFLHSALQEDRDFTPSDYQSLNPSGLRSINNALEFIKNARKMCHEIAGYVQRMCEIIRWHKLNLNNTERTLYLNETWDLAERRWTKELREFRKPSKNGAGDGFDFDISKIPDIYDNIKYDMEHNPDLCINNEGEFERFYLCVKNMADIVVPQEYGINEESKICIAQRSTSNEAGDESLTRLDPRASEGIATPMRHVRTRLYFTSESHIHTLMNLIRYGGLCSPDDKKWQRAMNFLSGVTEFNYMTQLVLMVYEDSRTEEEKSEGGRQQGTDIKDRFHIELLFSPGLYPCFQTEKERIYESRYSNRHKTSTSDGNKCTKGNRHNNSTAAGGGNENTLSGCGEDKVYSSASLATKLTEVLDIGKFSENSQIDDCPTRESASTQPKCSNRAGNESTSEESYTKEEGNGGTYRQNSRKSADDDDDLPEENAVNLVVLDEVSAASGAKTFCKGDLARHSPTSMEHPMRKRHATFERDSLKTLSKSREEGTKVKEKTMSEFEKKCEDGNGVGERLITFERRESDGRERQERPHGHQHYQKSIVKSMSDLFANRQKLEEIANDDEDDFKSDVNDGGCAPSGVIAQSANELKLDEGQATVGHGRGEWAKQLLEGTKVKEGQSPTKQQNVSGDIGIGEDVRPNCSSTNIARIPLSSVFEGISTDGQKEGADGSDRSTEEETNRRKKEQQKDTNSKEQTIGTRNSPDTTESTESTIHTQQSSATIKDEDTEEHNRLSFRRTRFPYRFKHHTVNLLTGAATENRLISTDVLMGKFSDKTKRKASSNSVVLSTAVIGVRSSSAPRLQTYNAGDELSVNEIRRFWPPLRSLETMHDNLSWKEVDEFLKRMMKNCTPLPSPPKTPATHFDESVPMLFADKRKSDSTICRLPPLEH